MANKHKTIKLSVNIQAADRLRKAAQTVKFLDKKMGVRVELRLRGWREANKQAEAMEVVKLFIEDTGVLEKKVNEPKWNNRTLQLFIHP